MNTLKQKIAAAIPNHLVFLDLVTDKHNARVKIVVDGAQAVDLNTTTAIAREVNNLELLTNDFPNGVQLEVTSPGIDAPLVHPLQYEKNIGRTIKVYTFGKNEPVVVELTHVNDSGFEGKASSGEPIAFQYDQIESAKVEIKF